MIDLIKARVSKETRDMVAAAILEPNPLIAKIRGDKPAVYADPPVQTITNEGRA